MGKSNKKVWIITSALVVIGGVVGYFLWKRNKDKSSDSQLPADTSMPPSTTSGGGSSTTIDKPSDVLAFQKFANSKGYTPKLVEDGAWGGKTSTAWSSLKAQWNAKQNTASSINTTDLLAGDINGANGRNIIAAFNGALFFNMQNQKAGTVSQGVVMGKVTKAIKTKSGTYQVFYIAPNGVKYFTSSSNVNVV